MEPNVLIHYTFGTKQEGWRSFAAFVIIIIVLLPIANLTDIREQAPLACLAVNVLALIFVALLFGYAVPNIVSGRKFEYVVAENRVECRFPSRLFGKSYTIPIDEIVMLERCFDGEDVTWRLVTRDDRHISIECRYENPVTDIVKALRQLRPNLPVKEL